MSESWSVVEAVESEKLLSMLYVTSVVITLAVESSISTLNVKVECTNKVLKMCSNSSVKKGQANDYTVPWLVAVYVIGC